MKPACPQCRTPLAPEDLNAPADVAVCRSCGELTRLSVLLAAAGELSQPGRGALTQAAASGLERPVDLGQPPKGVTLVQEAEGFRISVSLRSAAVLFTLPFQLVWSGGSLGGIYGSQIARGQFDPLMSLFGLPFLIGSLILGAVNVMGLFGRWTLEVHRGEGKVWVGALGLGRTRTFTWRGLSEVVLRPATLQNKNGSGMELELRSAKDFRLGATLSNDRLEWIGRALNQLRKRYR